jgi:hypothetical protein
MIQLAELPSVSEAVAGRDAVAAAPAAAVPQPNAVGDPGFPFEGWISQFADVWELPVP